MNEKNLKEDIIQLLLARIRLGNGAAMLVADEIMTLIKEREPSLDEEVLKRERDLADRLADRITKMAYAGHLTPEFEEWQTLRAKQAS